MTLPSEYLSRFIYGTKHYLDPGLDLVVVTGGSRGLGKAITKKLVDNKIATVVIDIEIPRPDQRIHGVLDYLECDVADRDEVMEVAQEIIARFGTVTALINNAATAIGKGKFVAELTSEEVQRGLAVNLAGQYWLVQAFLPTMAARHRGYIVSIGSVLSYVSPSKLSLYSATKSALLAFHESLSYELGPPSRPHSGIQTLLITPGHLRTQMFQDVQSPAMIFAPVQEPAQVATVIVHAMMAGQVGELRLPLYGKLIPIMRALPWQLIERLRSFAGIDEALDFTEDTASDWMSTKLR